MTDKCYVFLWWYNYHCLFLFASFISRSHFSSSSSSSNASISEHSRLHKLTPLCTILHTHPRCVKTNVVRPKVELYCTEPCPPWSTCQASPIRWRTIDGCSKNPRVVLVSTFRTSWFQTPPFIEVLCRLPHDPKWGTYEIKCSSEWLSPKAAVNACGPARIL